MIQTEGFSAARQVDPNLVLRKKGDKEEEVQDGWVGHIIPFELVQTTLLKADYDAVKAKEARQEAVAAELAELIDSIEEGDRGAFLNEDNTAFVPREFSIKLAELYAEVSSPELSGLQGYLELFDAHSGKAVRLQYIADHPEVNWAAIDGNVPYARGKAALYRKTLREAYVFPEGSFEAKMVRAGQLMDEEKSVRKQAREMAAALHLLTKETIEALTDVQVLDLLRLKWIAPLCASLRAIPEAIIETLEQAVQRLAEKYAVTYQDLGRQIEESEQELSLMIDQLTGDEYDMKGLAEFQSLLSGE